MGKRRRQQHAPRPPPKPKGLILGPLNRYNARYPGSKIKVFFDDRVWHEGTVVKTSGDNNIVVFFKTVDFEEIEIDPDGVMGVLTHCPIRVGSDYQAVIPDLV